MQVDERIDTTTRSRQFNDLQEPVSVRSVQPVRRLLELSDNNSAVGKISLLKTKYSLWLYLCFAFSAVLFLASNKSLLMTIHNVSENVVAILQ